MSEAIIEQWQAGNTEHAQAFADINRGWVEEFFVVEPKDAAMFGDPQSSLIDEGGMIFFARLEGRIVGVIGLLNMGGGVYELSKMGVVSGMRGKGIGRKLALALIAYARSIGARKLYIASNRKLEQAITLYKSLG
ncbi:MAG: GNAT family N-acetyltransferase, partial [Alphaproteobacteria bacterium]